MLSTTYRFPVVFKNQAATSVASEATVWAPSSSGLKFRLMYMLIAGSVAGTYTFKDGNSGNTILSVVLDGSTSLMIPLGPTGILSTAKGNNLRCVGPAASTITGMIYGT